MGCSAHGLCGSARLLRLLVVSEDKGEERAHCSLPIHAFVIPQTVEVTLIWFRCSAPHGDGEEWTRYAAGSVTSRIATSTNTLVRSLLSPFFYFVFVFRPGGGDSTGLEYQKRMK